MYILHPSNPWSLDPSIPPSPSFLSLLLGYERMGGGALYICDVCERVNQLGYFQI